MDKDKVNTSAFKEFEQQGWNRVANSYHDYFGQLTQQSIPSLLAATRVIKGSKVLDIASGPGYVAAAAAQLGAEVIGVDLSEMMVALATKLHPQLQFQLGDAEHLPFSDNEFAAVVINYGLLHFHQPEKALVEAYRVLRPQGRMGFTVWAKPEQAKAFGIVYGAIAKYGTMAVSLPAGPPFFRFSEVEEAKKILRQAGFSHPTVQTVPQIWHLRSPELLVEAFLQGTGRTGPLLQAQTPQAQKNIIAAVLTQAKHFRTADGSLQIPMPAILAAATKPRH